MGTGAVQRLQDLEFRLNIRIMHAIFHWFGCHLRAECMFWWQLQCPIVWWSKKHAEAISPVPRCWLLFAWRRVASTAFPENLPRTSRTQALNGYQSGCNWVFQWLPSFRPSCFPSFEPWSPSIGLPANVTLQTSCHESVCHHLLALQADPSSHRCWLGGCEHDGKEV